LLNIAGAKNTKKIEMKRENNTVHTILIIEDNIDMLQLIGRILYEEGYRVLMAQDSIYGISLLKESNPDIVLLDIRMPEPDGFETLELIRRQSSVPVIMVTANWEHDAMEKALSLGADDYMKKPFSPAELAARVRAQLQRRDRTG
jgi:DNA-binding response OmpR family regulator